MSDLSLISHLSHGKGQLIGVPLFGAAARQRQRLLAGAPMRQWRRCSPTRLCVAAARLGKFEDQP